MSHFYLDASAWVKRYIREPGTDWILRFWSHALPTACSTLGLIETLSTVVRRHVAGDAPAAATAAARDAIDRDFNGFCRIAVSTNVIAIAPTLPEKHQLRGADCIHLASALLLRQDLGETVTVIACDTELLHAAQAEGLPTLDPLAEPALPLP